MGMEELSDYNQSLCIQHFLKRLDFPTNNNEAERKWYSEQFRKIKLRKAELKEKGE
jgi:hypothetical protein